MPEYLYNALVSYIDMASGLDHAATTIDLVDTGLFPTACSYRISVDQEIMLVTACSAGVLTVTRGEEGTVAASHANNTPVFLVMTAGGFNAWGGGGGGSGAPTPCGGTSYHGSSVSVPTGAWTGIECTHGALEIGTAVAETSGPLAGYWSPGTAGTFGCFAEVYCAGSGSQAQVGIMQNNSPVANGIMAETPSGYVGTLLTLVTLAATDSVGMGMYYASGSLVPDNSGLCRFTFWRIS